MQSKPYGCNFLWYYNHNNFNLYFNMSYVHGLGDAQEALAKQWDIEHEWIKSIEMFCSHCKSVDTDWEDYETISNESGVDYAFFCVCQNCEKEFVYHHYVDMT